MNRMGWYLCALAAMSLGQGAVAQDEVPVQPGHRSVVLDDENAPRRAAVYVVSDESVPQSILDDLTSNEVRVVKTEVAVPMPAATPVTESGSEEHDPVAGVQGETVDVDVKVHRIPDGFGGDYHTVHVLADTAPQGSSSQAGPVEMHEEVRRYVAQAEEGQRKKKVVVREYSDGVEVREVFGADNIDHEVDVHVNADVTGHPRFVSINEIVDSEAVWTEMERHLEDAGLSEEQLESVRMALDAAMKESKQSNVSVEAGQNIFRVRTPDGNEDVRIVTDPFTWHDDGKVYEDLGHAFKDIKVSIPEMARRYMIGIDAEGTEEGVKVISVIEDTPAAKAGIKPGYVLQLVDAARVATVDELNDLVQKAGAANKTMRLELKRDTGGKYLVHLKPAKRPPIAVNFQRLSEDQWGQIESQNGWVQNFGAPIPFSPAPPPPPAPPAEMNERFEDLNVQMEQMQEQLKLLNEQLEHMRDR